MGHDANIPIEQREVQRLLGRCLLLLQQYELLLKCMLRSHQMSMTFDPSGRPVVKQPEVRTKTLGTLMKDFCSSYLRSEASQPASESPVESDLTSFSLKFSTTVNAEDYERVTNGLDKLVKLRNHLVHHFIEHADLATAEGCLSATAFLKENNDEIESKLRQLKELALEMEASRQVAAAFMANEEIWNFVEDGIFPDGTIHWELAGICEYLNEVSRRSHVEGWTAVRTAENWIQDNDPEQTPQRYRCSSLRQVIHESKRFELRYIVIDGKKTAHYRPLAPTSNLVS
jgi:hypothetical protein